MTENEKYVYDGLMNSIKAGFSSLDDIIDETLEIVEDEGWETEISGDWIREHVTREYNKHEEKSKMWQKPTDPDRLVDAFDKLRRQKIVALHNAGYTQEDALYDVKEVWEDLEDIDVHPVGYCYYHGQDIERAIEDNILCIGFYGKKEKNDKEAIMIGNTIVNVLKESGFEVNWNNTASKRIEIQDFEWHNAFTSYDDVEEKWGYDQAIKIISE
jgi:hypothetical protein